MLVPLILFSNVSDGSFILRYFTVAIFASEHRVFISNTATKKVPENQELGYRRAVFHQRLEGEFPVPAAGSAWGGTEQGRNRIPGARSLLPFMPSVRRAVAVPQPSLSTHVCRRRGEFGAPASSLGSKSPQMVRAEGWDHAELLGYPCLLVLCPRLPELCCFSERFVLREGIILQP